MTVQFKYSLWFQAFECNPASPIDAQLNRRAPVAASSTPPTSHTSRSIPSVLFHALAVQGGHIRSTCRAK